MTENKQGVTNIELQSLLSNSSKKFSIFEKIKSKIVSNKAAKIREQEEKNIVVKLSLQDNEK